MGGRGHAITARPRDLAVNDSRTFVLRSAGDVRGAVDRIRALELGPGRRPVALTIAPHEERITDAQRGLLFALCGEIAQQVEFPGGGRADAEAWKDFLVGLARGERIAREGWVVVIVGGSISGATKSEASDLIAFVEAWGAQRGVRFTEPEGRR